MKAKNIYLKIYIDAAKKLGIKYRVLEPLKLVEFSHKDKEWRIFQSRTPINTSVAWRITKYKNITSKILKLNNLPVPKQETFSSKDDAVKFFNKKTFKDLVVKPRHGLGGKGVSIKPKSLQEFKGAIDLAFESDKKVIVEEFIKGVDYRILVLDGKVLAVAKRLPALIVGNGKDTIETLVKEENAKRETDSKKSKILFDEASRNVLIEKGLNNDSVPQKDEVIYLRRNSNLSTGGTTIDRTDLIHPDNAELAIQATQTVGLVLCDVDLIINDISKSYKIQNCAVNELNDNPGLRIHLYPTEGEAREVDTTILEYIKDNVPNQKFQ